MKKRVVRFDLWLDASFDERMRREPDIELEVHKLASPEAKLLAALREAHVYQVGAAKDELPARWWVSERLLAGCPKLVAVSSYGAGHDTVDVAACSQAGVAVLNQVGANAVSVGEHAMGLILSLMHRIAESDRRLRKDRGYIREDLMGREIAGKVLGLVGIGHTGSRVAMLAKAFGMEVIAADPKVAPEEVRRRGALPVSFQALLAQADIVSLHCPRDATTMGMMDAGAFGRMKPGALFITTSRGGIHDEAALEVALRSGHLGGAGLDVWDKEPPPLGHPLLALENVIATFHTAGVTQESRRAMASWGADQAIAFLKGGKPPRLANPDAWPAIEARRRKILGG